MKITTSCPNCGQALAEGAQTCSRCGTAVCLGCGAALLPQDRFCGRCGTSRDGRSPADPTLLDPAGDAWDRILESLRQATLGEFVVRSELGRGGMAAVYLAHDIALNCKVAIKVMAPGLLTGRGMVERFKLEAVTIANLNHPNIVTIRALRQAAGLHFFVMKLIPGRSLERIIRDLGPLPLPVLQAILFQVGSALNYAHRRGVVHRDVKPSNILMDENGNAVVTDFGIARVVETPSHTQTGSTVGTPAYMSPEQCWSKEVTGASDQYSLGVVAYELLTGEPPFTGPTFNILRAHTEDPPPSVRARRPDCPPEIEAAVLRMLAKQPSQRWPTVMNAVEALGGRQLGESDPLRETLTSLGHREADQPSLDDPRTPRSPIPSREVIQPEPPLDGPTVLPGPSLAVSAPSSSLRVGAAMQLRVAARHTPGTPIPASAVSWTSSDQRVANVSAGGVVRGLEPGSVTVTAKARDGASGAVRLRVVVVPVGAVEVASPQPSIQAGDEVVLAAVVRATDGSILTDRSVTWTSSAPRIASVSPDGRLSAWLAGDVTISASADGVLGYLTLSVEPAPAPVPEIAPRPPRRSPTTAWLEHLAMHLRRPRSWAVLGVVAAGALAWLAWPDRKPSTPSVPVIAMLVTPPQLALRVGDSAGLQATVSSPSVRASSGRVIWASSDTAVAGVSATGVVTGRRPGGATVTATEGGVQGQATVTVTAGLVVEPAPVATIDVRPERLRLGVGRSASLRAITRDATGASLEGRAIVWSSSDQNIARVSRSGGVTGMASGEASITATSGEVASAPVPVTVEAPPPETQYGTVRMLVVPWAYVSIDGRPREQRVRGEDRLTAGVLHRLRFERGGFATIDTALVLQPGEQRLLRIQMKAR